MKKKTIGYYLHGTNGSFDVEKKRMLEEIFDIPVTGRTYSSGMHTYLKEALKDIGEIARENNVIIIGKSLGGLIGAIVGERLAIPQILINPVLVKESLLISEEEISRSFGEGYAADLNSLMLKVNLKFKKRFIVATADDHLLNHTMYGNTKTTFLPQGGHSIPNLMQAKPEIRKVILDWKYYPMGASPKYMRVDSNA